MASLVSMLGASDEADTDGRSAQLFIYHYSSFGASPSAAAVASGGSLLSFTGQAGRDIINFAYSLSTSNPTMNPTPSFSYSCFDIKRKNPSAPNGKYLIRPKGLGGQDVEVECEMERDGGGASNTHSYKRPRTRTRTRTHTLTRKRNTLNTRWLDVWNQELVSNAWRSWNCWCLWICQRCIDI